MSHNIKPENHELQKARKIAETTLSSCEPVLPKSEDFEIFIGVQPFTSTGQVTDTAITVFFDPEEDWEDGFRNAVARGYAESWFREHTGTSFHWEDLLVLGHALKFAEQITGKKPELDSPTVLKDNWLEVRDEIGELKEKDIDVLNQYGFSTAYFVAEKLIEDHGIQEFPEFTRSDFIEAGDQIFQ